MNGESESPYVHPCIWCTSGNVNSIWLHLTCDVSTSDYKRKVTRLETCTQFKPVTPLLEDGTYAVPTGESSGSSRPLELRGAEHESTPILQNVRNCLPVDVASYLRTLESSKNTAVTTSNKAISYFPNKVLWVLTHSSGLDCLCEYSTRTSLPLSYLYINNSTNYGQYGIHEKCIQNFVRKTLNEETTWKTSTILNSAWAH
jgi:hypothetical protein